MQNSSNAEERYHSTTRFNSVSSNVISYINPWIPLWWSAAFPGYGYLLTGNSVTAFIFVCFEFIMNNMAHLNEAIFRSMIGDIEGAKSVINIRWFFGYIGVYVFAMYDSYRRAVENNKLYLLSYRYTRKRSFTALSSLGHNMIEKTSPLNAFFWSFITPGLGAVFTHRLPPFVFALAWWGVVSIKSRWFEAIYYSALGNFKQASNVLDPQWFLFIPSITGFAMYFGYRNTVIANKQFKLSQAQYLKDAYQSPHFNKPI